MITLIEFSYDTLKSFLEGYSINIALDDLDDVCINKFDGEFNM